MTKRVLEEEEYITKLEEIIERDYFPDLASLRKQNQDLTYGYTSRDEDRRNSNVVISSTSSMSGHNYNNDISSWDVLTPLRTEMEGGEESQQEDVDSDDTKGKELSLSQFVATHTTEDNVSFVELQKKTIDDHRRNYHWAYDIDPDKGDPKLHLLKDGTWISKEQRLLIDQACTSNGIKDERPTAPETWNFRARNPLLFPPDLGVNRSICQLPENVPKTAQHLLEGKRLPLLKDGAATDSQPTKSIAFANTRFPSTALSNPSTERDQQPRETLYDLVSMTPQVEPGIDASPLMTWGKIQGTPILLNSNEITPSSEHNANIIPSFKVNEKSQREKLAEQLESKSRLSKTPLSSSMRLSNRQSRTPSTLRHRLPTGRRPKIKKIASNSNSASSRINKIALLSATRTPSDYSELRASYATPGRTSIRDN